MLLKTRNNVIGVAAGTGTSRVNIDGIRTDGTYTVSDETGGGTYPASWTQPGSLVVSNSGDTQTLTDGDSTVFVRNYGLDGWTTWA